MKTKVKKKLTFKSIWSRINRVWFFYLHGVEQLFEDVISLIQLSKCYSCIVRHFILTFDINPKWIFGNRVCIFSCVESWLLLIMFAIVRFSGSSDIWVVGFLCSFYYVHVSFISVSCCIGNYKRYCCCLWWGGKSPSEIRGRG